MAMTRRQPCIVGPGAGARKYDLLTWLAVAGLHDRALSPVLALRLIALVTARYNWALDMASIGHEELARLWGVSRRTVIRDIEKLRAAGLIAVARPARRGRVAAYRLDQAAFAAPVALERWLAPLVCEGLRDGVMALRAPSPFHASYVNRTYGERLGRIAAALGPLKLRIGGQAPSRSGEAPS